MFETKPAFEYAVLPEAFFKRVPNAEFDRLNLIALNERLAKELSFDPAWLGGDAGLRFLSGVTPAEPAGAIAMAYAGHQFGHWSGMLGDGRARLAGEVIGRDGQRYDIHLKGAGVTPYSRRGDGRATLGSAIREYVVSEGMASLGIPTTGSLAIVATGEAVFRNAPEPGAVLARTARSHVRVGTFQYAAAYNDLDDVKALADFSINRLYPEAPATGADRYRYFFRQIVLRQARLIADWMALGFIHGVMNTDNMAVSGETIDYGPCAYMDEFHPAKVFSSIDQHGRYAWNRQPEMAHWNLVRLAETLIGLFGEDEDIGTEYARRMLDEFSPVFEMRFNEAFAAKFGIEPGSENLERALPALFSSMVAGRCDFTRLFTALTRHAAGELQTVVLDEFVDRDRGLQFVETWKSAAGAPADTGRLEGMKKRNPVIIPRNHRIEKAIADANQGEFSAFQHLLDALQSPFEESSRFSDFESAPEQDEIVRQTFCGT